MAHTYTKQDGSRISFEHLGDFLGEVVRRCTRLDVRLTEGERDRLIDEELKKRGYPANTRNAARAGWYAALASSAVRVPMPVIIEADINGLHISELVCIDPQELDHAAAPLGAAAGLRIVGA